MTKILTVFLLLLVFLACERASTQTTNEESQNIVAQTPAVEIKTKDCVTMKFKYLEVANYNPSPTLRRIDVFLDVKAFTEENLKTLFSYLSDKYTGPKYLIVVVYTDWAQLQNASDCPGTGASNMPRKPDEYDYHKAIFRRYGKNQFFRYNPVLKVEDADFKTVVLSGEVS
jgi:hypothetical protein